MSATALFVEILITGLETAIWFGFLLGCFFGTGWISFLTNSFQVAQAFTTTVLLGFIYVIGIIFEEVTDALFEPWSDRIKASLNKGSMSQYISITTYVYSRYSMKQDDQINYMRSRRRILRSSAFNILMIAISSLIYLWIRISSIAISSKISISVFILVIGILGIWLSLFTYKRITTDYVHSVQGIYTSLMSDKKKSTSKKSAKGSADPRTPKER